MNIEIRKLQSSDWPLWKEIRLEALQFHPEAFGGSYEEVAPLPKEEFQQMLTKNDVFGAFIDNRLIGTTGFFIYALQKYQHRGSIFAVYVNEHYRKQGIAGQLLEKVIEHAREKVIQLHCTVTTSNPHVVKFYEKLGFEIYGTEPRSLLVGDKYYDEHFMVLRFN